MYGPLLSNAGGIQNNLEGILLRDIEQTMPPRKHGLGISFLLENLLNACPGSLAMKKPLTGFLELQEKKYQ